MKKILYLLIICNSILSSCAKEIDSNYVDIDGKQYFVVPRDYFADYRLGGKYIETFTYTYPSISGLNPAQPYHKCDSNCSSQHLPTEPLVQKLDELKSQLSPYAEYKYYLIAEFAYTYSEHGATTGQWIQIDYIVSPWRIAKGRKKEITITENGEEITTKIIEIIEDYIE